MEALYRQLKYCMAMEFSSRKSTAKKRLRCIKNLSTADGQQSNFSGALTTSNSMKEHGRRRSEYSASTFPNIVGELTAEALFHG